MSETTPARAERMQTLWRLTGSELLQHYNEAMGLPPGTLVERHIPKESMVRSILLKEGFVSEVRHDAD